MSTSADGGSVCRALDAVAETALALSGASFDEVLLQGPTLVLEAIPGTCCVELSVARRGQMHPVSSRADGGEHSSPTWLTSSKGQVLSLRLSPRDCGATGHLVLTAESDEGFTGTAALTAELMAIQIEQALDLAHARAVNGDLQVAMAGARDLGIAIGLVMAGQDLSEDSALDSLRGLGHDARQELVSIAEDLTRAARGSRTPRLRLVSGGGTATRPSH